MPDSDSCEDAPDDTSAPPKPASPPGAPRWVKATVIAVLLVIVVLVVSQLVGVDHGPGRHSASGGVAGLSQHPTSPR